MPLLDAPVSIDVGSFSVKVAQVQAGRGGVRALRFAEQRLPEGFHWQADASIAPLVTAIRQALQRAGIRSRRAVLALPRRHVIARVSPLPPAERAQLQRVVEMDLADHVPFPVEQVVVDFQALGPSLEQPGMTDVLVVAAQRDLVRQYLDLARALGMRVAALTIDAFALHDLATLRKETGPGVQLTLEVGRRSTTVTVSQDRRLRLSRSIPLGTLQLDAALREDLGLSAEEAEARRVAEGLHTPDDTPRPARVAAWLDHLRGEVRRTALSFGQTAVSRVLLLGAGAQTPGLAQALGAEFQVPALVLSAASLFPTAQFRSPGPGVADRCLLALGMALRGAGRSGFTLSLVPREVSAARREVVFQRAAVAAALVLAGVLALSYVSTKHKLVRLRAQHAQVTRAVRAAEEKAGEVKQVQESLTHLQRDLRELQPAQVRRYVALELLKTISEGANPEIILTSFELRPQQPLILRGTAPDAGAAADLQAVLLRSPLVTRASMERVDVLSQPGRVFAPRSLPPLGAGKAALAADESGPGPRVSFMLTVHLRTEKAPRTRRSAPGPGGVA